MRELVARFKELATREIAEMLRRYRKLCRLGDRLSLKRLKWRRAGRVWAADHAKSPGRKGRRARQIFAVRDLASGRQITWQFVPEETAATTIAILEEHFERHGAPLVLKLDNGPAFASSEMERFLERWGVELLASPVRTPSFNGAIERAVGVLKRETRRSARAAGRSAKDWREEDLEGARGVNNARPALGERKRSREEVWSQREWITPQERERFRESVREEELKELSAPRYPRSAGEMSRLERQTIRRRAVTRALRAHDILQVRSRRISELILRLRGAGNVQG
ncbi:MAG: transposase family protein [Gemmatimonadales bacterium]